jgi:hypothetical protein
MSKIGENDGRYMIEMSLQPLGNNRHGQILLMPSRRNSTLHWERDQTVLEYTDIFHTLHSKLGIRDFE